MFVLFQLYNNTQDEDTRSGMNAGAPGG